MGEITNEMFNLDLAMPASGSIWMRNKRNYGPHPQGPQPFWQAGHSDSSRQIAPVTLQCLGFTAPGQAPSHWSPDVSDVHHVPWAVKGLADICPRVNICLTCQHLFYHVNASVLVNQKENHFSLRYVDWFAQMSLLINPLEHKRLCQWKRWM